VLDVDEAVARCGLRYGRSRRWTGLGEQPDRDRPTKRVPAMDAIRIVAVSVGQVDRRLGIAAKANRDLTGRYRLEVAAVSQRGGRDMSESADEPEAAKKPDHSIVVTPHALVVTLSPAMQRSAQECLKRSGKVTFSMKEVSVTRLPDTLLGDGVQVD
jgi:hypothetical protein